MTKTDRVLAACGILLASFTSLSAGVSEKFGLSAWQTSLSGAGNAAMGDPAAAYYNPAGLAGVGQGHEAAGVKNALMFDLGYQQPDFKISPNAGSALSHANAKIGADVLAYTTLNFGFAADLRSIMRTPDDIPITLGLVASIPGDGTQLIRFSEATARAYEFQGVGKSAVRPTVAASLAVQVWRERLSLGVGATILAGVKGRVEVQKIDTTTSEPVTPTTDVFLSVRLKPSALTGMQFRQPIGDHTIFVGGAWRQENYISGDLNAAIQLPPVMGISVLHQTAMQLLGYYEPHVFTAGLGYSWKRLAVFADVEYQMWSRFSRGFTRELIDGLPAFKDIMVYRGGVEVTLPVVEIKTRAGYAFVPAFTPDQTGISNYLDNDKHVLSFGIGKFFPSMVGMRTPVKFEAAFQWQYWVTRRTFKDVQDVMTDGTYQPGYFYGGNLFLGHVSATLYL